MKDLFSLAGRTALVTGSSRGIGRMIAAGFLAQGARVYISSRKAAACEQTALELAATGSCFALPADVPTLAGAQCLAAALAERESQLDILVNNAGAAWAAAFDEFPEAGWDKAVDLNLKAPFFLTQALHEMLRRAAQHRPAKVINIASWVGHEPRRPRPRRRGGAAHSDRAHRPRRRHGRRGDLSRVACG